ncbi:MAG: AAA family ATPase [Candidatus Omnitrophica bacterium]|nr:AAA family ATPase [Candidatus Omnitrophota bacterium]
MTNQNKQSFAEILSLPDFPERQAEIRSLQIGLLSGESVLFIGSPGTAKSLVVEAFASGTGLSYFRWLLTKFTTPEEIFGALDLQALEQGHFQRNIAGKLPDCEIGFVDEVFKASSSILNSLLTIMQERLFFNNGTPVKVPLKLLVGASNELPDDDSLGALFDRFLIRNYVNYVSDQNSIKKIWDNPPQIPSSLISRSDLEKMLAELDHVQFPSEIQDIILILKLELENQGIKLSDRRWIKSKKILQATALVAGRDKVENCDLSFLTNLIWRTPDEISKIRQIIGEKVLPHLAEIQKIEDVLSSIMEELGKKSSPDKSDKSDKSDKNAVFEATMTTQQKIKELIKQAQAVTDCDEKQQLLNKLTNRGTELSRLLKEMIEL